MGGSKAISTFEKIHLVRARGAIFRKSRDCLNPAILEYVSGRVRTQISSRTVSVKIWTDPVRADPVGADPSVSRSSAGRSQRGPPPGPGRRSLQKRTRYVINPIPNPIGAGFIDGGFRNSLKRRVWRSVRMSPGFPLESLHKGTHP